MISDMGSSGSLHENLTQYCQNLSYIGVKIGINGLKWQPRVGIPLLVSTWNVLKFFSCYHGYHKY